jgi:hypothetical protein
MTDRDIKRLLKIEAAGAAVPDVLSGARANAAFSGAAGAGMMNAAFFDAAGVGGANAVPARRKANAGAWRRRGLYAAAGIFIFLFAYFAVPRMAFDKSVYAFVSLDAGFEIGVNKAGRVVDIKAGNDGAAAILSGVSYKKQPLETVLHQILCDCIDSGLIGGEDAQKRYVPFSVHCMDEGGSEDLRLCVERMIEVCCGQGN